MSRVEQVKRWTLDCSFPCSSACSCPSAKASALKGGCELVEFRNAELFGTLASARFGNQRGVETPAFDAVAERLSALAERGFHDATEVLEGDAVGQVRDVVSDQANDATLHLGWRVKRVFVHREQVLDVVVGLKQDAQDAIRLGARPLGDPLGDLLLKHAHAFRHAVPPVQDAEQDLRADVVQEIAGHDERRPARERLVGVPLQQVDTKHPVLRQHVSRSEVRDRLVVEFDGSDVEVSALEEQPGQRAGSGTHLQHVRATLVLCDALGDHVRRRGHEGSAGRGVLARTCIGDK